MVAAGARGAVDVAGAELVVILSSSKFVCVFLFWGGSFLYLCQNTY